MARVRFTSNFDYKPSSSITIGYRAGMEVTVRRECADQAIAKGKAEEVGKAEPERGVKRASLVAVDVEGADDQRG